MVRPPDCAPAPHRPVCLAMDEAAGRRCGWRNCLGWDVEDTVPTVGTVLPVDQFEARSSFPAAVEKIHVQFRQHVRAGQLLVTMKDPFANSRVAAADASPQSAEVSRENVQHNGSQEDRINFASDLDHAQAERPMLSALSTRCRTSARRGMKGS